jgi:MFS family permease
MPFLLDRGLEPTISAAVVSVGAASLGAGGIIWGLLAERARVNYLLAAVTASSAASLAMLLLTHSAPLAFAYAVMNGVALGGTFTLEVIIWADYFGRRSLGTIQGFTLPFVYVGTAVGPLVAGLSYDLVGSYQVVFITFIVGYFLAAAMLVAAKPPRKATPGVLPSL